jgi:predicted Zn-dependent protease
MRKFSLLVAGVACLSLGQMATEPVFAAKEKKASAPSVPKSFTAKEKENGAKYHTEILKEFGGAYQSPQTDYVVRVGKKIAMQSGMSQSESDITVTFLNSPVNNAFAIEGGYIYITRQLVALCNSEAEMAGVLGHEDGHTVARHVRKRQKRSTILGILGAVGTIGGAILGDNGGLAGILGQGLKEYSGTVAQLFTLSFSRAQEEQADDLGIQYLSKAGYDPTALSAMLNSLAMQSAVDQRAAGHLGGAIPEWQSTHPDPIKRVGRALTVAAKYPKATLRNADVHLKTIDGMMFDDDPKEGVVDGQEFLHRDMKLKFAVPTGYGMANSSQAVQISGNGGKSLFTIAGAYNGDKAAYVAAALKQLSGDQQTIPAGPITETTVNGVPAFYSESTVQQQNGAVRVTVFAYANSATQALHFISITPANAGNPFESMYQSFARLSASEAAAIKERKLRVVTVGKSDSVASLSGKMAYKSFQTERFLALNGLAANAVLTSGQKVKIVTY